MRAITFASGLALTRCAVTFSPAKTRILRLDMAGTSLSGASYYEASLDVVRTPNAVSTISSPFRENAQLKARMQKIPLLLSPGIFLIPTLGELTLQNIRFRPMYGQHLLDSPHQRQTALRKLTLKECYIHDVALRGFLAMPKALTHLVIDHVGMWYPISGPEDQGSPRVEPYMSGVELHKDSLEVFQFSESIWVAGMDYSPIDVRDFERLRVLTILVERTDAEPIVEVLHDSALECQRLSRYVESRLVLLSCLSQDPADERGTEKNGRCVVEARVIALEKRSGIAPTVRGWHAPNDCTSEY